MDQKATQAQVIRFILDQFKQLQSSEFEMTVSNGEKTLVIAVAVTAIEPTKEETK